MNSSYHDEHVMNLPRKIVVGVNVRKNIGKYIKELIPGRNITVFIVTGPHVVNIVGKEVSSILIDEGFDTHIFIAKRADQDNVERALRESREVKSRVVIGLGGGKCIDVAKVVASRTSQFFISMPTAASHDGIASPFASIKGLAHPISVKAIEPSIIVADIEVISKAPKRLIAAGAGDIIAKFTAIRDWQLAHKLRNEYYGAYAASLALLSAKHVVSYADEIGRCSQEGVRVLVEALISSGVAICIAGSTRPASGSEHLFSHALDLIAPNPALHGEQVGVGTIMMAYLHGINWRKIKKVLKRIGAPTTAKELGIDDEYIIKALTIAHKIRPERYTILGEKGLTWKAAERLARITGVID